MVARGISASSNKRRGASLPYGRVHRAGVCGIAFSAYGGMLASTARGGWRGGNWRLRGVGLYRRQTNALSGAKHHRGGALLLSRILTWRQHENAEQRHDIEKSISAKSQHEKAAWRSVARDGQPDISARTDHRLARVAARVNKPRTSTIVFGMAYQRQRYQRSISIVSAITPYRRRRG